MKLLRNNQSGFTLVELMVVVAIIGILASLAIPQYSKFQAKARQSEAKVGLSGLYTAEQSFQAEQGKFTTSFEDIGFSASGGKRYYSIGYSASNRPGTTALPNFTSAGDTFKSVQNMCSGTTIDPTGTVSANFDTYTATANGVVSGKCSDTKDAWSISEKNILINTANGINN
jgi:type IV pilus assembly protein PilA